MGTYVESYAYDALGNIQSMGHQVASGGWTRRYAYNEASRIVAGETGNRLSATSLPGDPAAGPFSAAYSHDPHGNMTQMPHLPTMVWSENDYLRATARTVSGAGTPAMTYYAYAAGGQRVRKIVETQAAAGGAATRASERVYLGGVEVYREYAADGTTPTLLRETFPIMGGERADARVETRTLGTDPGPAQQVRYQFTNHLGSATLELGDAADVISYEEYFPFGATSYQAVENQTDVAKRYRYTGKERDGENGLYYHGARYYAPWLGKWTAARPSRHDRRLHFLYCYAPGTIRWPSSISEGFASSGPEDSRVGGDRTISSSNCLAITDPATPMESSNSKFKKPTLPSTHEEASKKEGFRTQRPRKGAARGKPPDPLSGPPPRNPNTCEQRCFCRDL